MRVALELALRSRRKDARFLVASDEARAFFISAARVREKNKDEDVVRGE